jgi:hypothetical protein
MAWRQIIETGGEVIGYFGAARLMVWDNAVLVLPSNGR